MKKFLLGMICAAACVVAGFAAARVLAHEEPAVAREAPPPPPRDRTDEVLDEVDSLREILKAFAEAVDVAAEERADLMVALRTARQEELASRAALEEALGELRRQVESIAERPIEVPAAPEPEPVRAVKEPAPAPVPAAPPPAEPSTPKRRSLAELLAAKKRVDPRDELTRYRLLDGYCNVGFDGVSTIHNFTAQSKKVSGELSLHLNDLTDAPSGRLVLPVASLDSGNAGRDEDMRTYLGAPDRPDIVCELLAFTKEGDARVRFTINGQAREVVTPVTVEFTDTHLLHVKGEAKLKMSDFGIKVKSAALGMVNVEDEVTIWWDLYAEVARDAAR